MSIGKSIPSPTGPNSHLTTIRSPLNTQTPVYLETALTRREPGKTITATHMISQDEYTRITGYTRIDPKTGIFFEQPVKNSWTPELKKLLDNFLNDSEPEWLFSENRSHRFKSELAEAGNYHYNPVVVKQNRWYILNNLAKQLEYGFALFQIHKEHNWEIETDPTEGWKIWDITCPIPIWTCDKEFQQLNLKAKSITRRLTKFQWIKWLKKELEKGITNFPPNWSKQWLVASEIDCYLNHKSLLRLSNMRIACQITETKSIWDLVKTSEKSITGEKQIYEIEKTLWKLHQEIKKEIASSMTDFFDSKVFIENGNVWMVQKENVYLATHGGSFNYVGSLYKGWDQNIPDIPKSVTQELAYYF